MRPGRVLLVFTLAVFVGGAFLAPWLYWLVQWGANHSSMFQSLAQNPFHRFVNRALLVLALAGLWPLTRALGMRSWKALGWVRIPRHVDTHRDQEPTGGASAPASRSATWPRLVGTLAPPTRFRGTPGGPGSRIASGFGLGFVSLALLAAIAVLSGAWRIHTDLTASRLFGKLGGAALSAVVVAILEETFFRGAVMGALRRAHSVGVALVLSSAIYAMLHFFQRPDSPMKVEWFTGLQLLPQMMRGFVDGRALVPGFFNLTLAGIILGLAYQHTGNLYFSMGLHGGWVFWLKFCSAVAGAAPGVNIWYWGSPGRLIDGWLALGVLAGVLLILMRLLKMEGTPHDAARVPDPA